MHTSPKHFLALLALVLGLPLMGCTGNKSLDQIKAMDPQMRADVICNESSSILTSRKDAIAAEENLESFYKEVEQGNMTSTECVKQPIYASYCEPRTDGELCYKRFERFETKCFPKTIKLENKEASKEKEAILKQRLKFLVVQREQLYADCLKKVVKMKPLDVYNFMRGGQ
ncbi:MAG: hypothetical protein ACYYK0_00775 [Candidatus Eutrophobiaceae bacterium]